MVTIIGFSFFNKINYLDTGVKIDPDYVPKKISLIPISIEKENKQFTLKGSLLPKFNLSLTGEEFAKLWTADAAERKKLVKTSLVNVKGDVQPKLSVDFNSKNKHVLVTPLIENKLKPGLYKLNITVKSSGGDVITQQDFSWGVMAINTSKSVYQQGEMVEIGMAVLGDYGNTKCIAEGEVAFNTAKVWLQITHPNGKVDNFSTDDHTILGSKECGDRTVTNNPDFFTNVAANEIGEYKVHMIAEHIFGKREMDYTFLVSSGKPDFEIERIEFPTRIYPKVDYPVNVSVRANRDFRGEVGDFVPESFQISHVSNNGIATTVKNIQQVKWTVNWKKDQLYTLSYTIHFPQVAPELYLVGPFTIGKFKDQHQWKIASDSIFQFIQESHNTGSGTSVSTTLPNSIGQNHLVIRICYRTNNASFSGGGGWSTAYNNSSGPRIYMYYRVAPAGMSTTVTCSTFSSGTIAVQALEFSGNSTSSVRDQRNRVNNSSTCNTGAHQNTNSNLTPGNPDVLAVSAFSATSTRTVTSHTNYTDSSSSFNASSGTFDSSWGEVVNNPPVATNDAATYDGGGGTCDNLQVTFNPQISVSQGGYVFFENADSPNPGNPLASQNQSITLNVPNSAFRLRILLDIDSPSGSTIGVGSGDWQLEYALMPESGDCSEGVYNPVDTIANGTPIAYNPNPSSGGNNVFISSSGNDPNDASYTEVYEDYIETWLNDSSEDVTNNQNTLGNNQAGMFDFSLIDNTTQPESQTYCLLVYNGDGSPLDGYRNFPTVTTPIIDVNIRGGTLIQGGTDLQ